MKKKIRKMKSYKKNIFYVKLSDLYSIMTIS